MSPLPHLVDAPTVMWRVARAHQGTRFSEIDPADALLPRAGNRFDVPGGGVLYTATDLVGCYREVLARLRPAPGMVDLDEVDGGHMGASNVAASWREARRTFMLSLIDPLPFVDVEHQATWNAVEADIPLLPGMDHLDVGQVRGSNRLLTRSIALWAYSRTDELGDPLYSGLRYVSRTGDFECWAVFDGTKVAELGPSMGVLKGDEALLSVAADYGLTIH